MEITKRLFRSNDRMLGGVCSGIDEYLGWDATIARIAYITLSLASIGFPGMLVYLILWIVMPPRY